MFFIRIIPFVFYTNYKRVGTSKHNWFVTVFLGWRYFSVIVGYHLVTKSYNEEKLYIVRSLVVYIFWTSNEVIWIWINRITTNSRWKFRIYNKTNVLTLYSFPLYTFSLPEGGPQLPKHVVSLIKHIQRHLCFDVFTPLKLILLFMDLPWNLSFRITLCETERVPIIFTDTLPISTAPYCEQQYNTETFGCLANL